MDEVEKDMPSETGLSFQSILRSNLAWFIAMVVGFDRPCDTSAATKPRRNVLSIVDEQ